MWKSHPKALPYLFLSEMWERFGYYLMIGIFTLYLKDVEAGFAMTEKEASDLYGTFIALVFLTPFIGGLVADRYLGYKKSALLLKKAGHKKINYHHRDLAIKHNAKGALILRYDNGLKIPEYQSKDFEDLEKLYTYDHNDLLIVSFAEKYRDAENSCLAIALEFNDHLKDLFRKF